MTCQNQIVQLRTLGRRLHHSLPTIRNDSVSHTYSLYYMHMQSARFTFRCYRYPVHSTVYLHYHIQRFKKSGNRKKIKEEALAQGRPEKGTTLDSDDYKKRMQKYILKLQQQLREIQPRTANTSVVEGIEINNLGKKQAIKKVADVSSRGIHSIAILPHKPELMPLIEEALLKFNEEFNPRCDTKSGLVMISVPKPNDEQLASLRFAVTTRREYAKRQCQDLMKVAMNEAKKMSEFLPKDDLHEYNVALNELVKEETKKIDELCDKKLKEFE